MNKEYIRYVECQACRQARLVKAADHEEADEKATKQCTCSEGKTLRYLAHLMTCIDNLCGPGSIRRGFVSIDDKVVGHIKEVTRLILEGKIERATFSLEGTIIYINRKGENVKIKRILFKTMETEP